MDDENFVKLEDVPQEIASPIIRVRYRQGPPVFVEKIEDQCNFYARGFFGFFNASNKHLKGRCDTLYPYIILRSNRHDKNRTPEKDLKNVKLVEMVLKRGRLEPQLRVYLWAKKEAKVLAEEMGIEVEDNTEIGKHFPYLKIKDLDARGYGEAGTIRRNSKKPILESLNLGPNFLKEIDNGKWS
jgi:hypothetical protein